MSIPTEKIKKIEDSSLQRLRRTRRNLNSMRNLDPPRLLHPKPKRSNSSKNIKRTQRRSFPAPFLLPLELFDLDFHARDADPSFPVVEWLRCPSGRLRVRQLVREMKVEGGE